MIHDQSAEYATIGAILDGADLPDLNPEDFFVPWCAKTFRAMSDLTAEGAPMDPVVVRDRAGVEAPLLLEAQKGAHPHRIAEYAGIVREKSRIRSVVRAAQEVAGRATELSADEAESLLLSEAMTLTARSSTDSASAREVARDFAELAVQGGLEHITPPGLPSVPMLRGDVMVVGAPQGTCKTSLLCWWVDEWSKHRKTLFVEYEQTNVQTWSRVQSRYSKVSMFDVIRGLDEDQTQRVLDAAGEERKLDLISPGPHVDRLLARLRRFAADGGEIAVIDHVGLVPYTNRDKLVEANAIGRYVSNPIKQLALDTGLWVVLVSQVNQGVSKGGKDRRYPWGTIGDLRSTGHLAQDASQVVMAHKWPPFDDEQGRKVRGGLNIKVDDDRDLIRLGVEKNRWGSSHHRNFLADLHANTFERV